MVQLHAIHHPRPLRLVISTLLRTFVPSDVRGFLRCVSHLDPRYHILPLLARLMERCDVRLRERGPIVRSEARRLFYDGPRLIAVCRRQAESEVRPRPEGRLQARRCSDQLVPQEGVGPFMQDLAKLLAPMRPGVARVADRVAHDFVRHLRARPRLGGRLQTRPDSWDPVLVYTPDAKIPQLPPGGADGTPRYEQGVQRRAGLRSLNSEYYWRGGRALVIESGREAREPPVQV